jgi:AraC family transcriptional regulator
MHHDLDPETIRCTSDSIGLAGFRVVIRELPPNGGFDSGRKGTQSFRLGYRPIKERGRTIFRFRRNPGHAVRMARVSAIIPPDEPFEASYFEADGKIASFEIHPAFFTDVINRAGISPVKLRHLPPAAFLINRRVDLLCSLLMQETEGGAPLGSLYFENLATALIIAVASQTDARLPNAGNLYIQHQQIQRVVLHIESNFAAKLTTQDLARVSNLSAFHFTRLFSRIVGLTPHEYILDCRIRFAERLLSLHGYESSIADVAAEAGFADQAHLSRHFRRVFGKSPNAYRLQQEYTKRAQSRSSPQSLAAPITIGRGVAGIAATAA